jgi:hypothetical protein
MTHNALGKSGRRKFDGYLTFLGFIFQLALAGTSISCVAAATFLQQDLVPNFIINGLYSYQVLVKRLSCGFEIFASLEGVHCLSA